METSIVDIVGCLSGTDFRSYLSTRTFLSFSLINKSCHLYFYPVICQFYVFSLKNFLHVLRYYKPRKLCVHHPFFSEFFNYFAPYLTHITFRDINPRYLCLPHGITHLVLGELFDQNVDYLPSTLTHIEFGNSFDQEVNFLPPNVTSIVFGNSFNRQVDYLPLKLTHLRFGGWFNRNVCRLPPNLMWLKFGYNFNQKVERLPQHLMFLSLHYNFVQSLDRLPLSLRQLEIYGLYSLPLDRLPFYLKHLSIISNRFQHPVDSLPPLLTHLVLHIPFKTPIDCLPSTITHLELGRLCACLLDNLPYSLTHLILGSPIHFFYFTAYNFPRDLRYLECTLTGPNWRWN